VRTKELLGREGAVPISFWLTGYHLLISASKEKKGQDKAEHQKSQKREGRSRRQSQDDWMKEVEKVVFEKKNCAWTQKKQHKRQERE
jgi:hypothetical protein